MFGAPHSSRILEEDTDTEEHNSQELFKRALRPLCDDTQLGMDALFDNTALSTERRPC
jgi:hypothetical protein